MDLTKTHETFPLWIVIVSNLFSVLIYLSGFIITISLHWIVAILYLLFIIVLEFRLIGKHCVNCYYWGKSCGFGKGKLSSLLFKRGSPSKFCERSFTWKEMIPDLLISLIPLLIAIGLMIISFNLILLFTVIIIIGLTTIGNGFIRGNLTCKYCKQRELGCPAEQLFNKKQKDSVKY